MIFNFGRYKSKSCLIYFQIQRGTMAKFGQEKVGQLIAQMGHYDPDNMEMAAKRLSELILAGQVGLEGDPKTANAIREAFMKQIQSENDTVQSEAIKYLADIIPKLPSEQVELIFEKILEHISNLHESEKKRQRYGACAATVIHQAAEEHGPKLQNLFVKSTKKLLQFKDRKTELEIILINIISQFLRKWPNIASHLSYDLQGVLTYLLKNIQCKNKLDIIKKSETCLAKLAIILDQKMINLALNDPEWGLLNFIAKSHSNLTGEALKHARNGLLCLAQIIKTHNIEVRHWAKDIAHLLQTVIDKFKRHNDIDNIEVVCDILDAALTALSYLIRTFSRELRQELQERNNPFNSFIKELIDFDVEGMMSYAGEEMECEDYDEDQDYYQEAEVDQKCWKVRRSALYYISFLAKYDPNFLKSLKQGDLIRDLGAKLIEQHSVVSEMAISTFNQLIELISIDRSLTNDEQMEEQLSLLRVKSSAQDVADLLIHEIESKVHIILNNSKFNDQLKVQSSKILLRIVQIYDQVLCSREQETFRLVGLLSEQLRKTSLVDCRVHLLECMGALVNQNYPFSRYQHVFDYFLETATKTNSIKIQAICLLTIRKFLDLFSSDLSGQKTSLQKVVNLVKAKIGELDTDKLIKQATCKCLTELFEHYNLQNDDIAYFLNALTNKLKIEVEKLYLIETLNRLHKQRPLSLDTCHALEGVIRQVADNLGSNNFELNLKSVECIDRLLEVLEEHANSKLLEYLLEKSRLILGEGKIPSFFRHIAARNPRLLKPHAELIIKSTESYYVAILLKENVVDIKTCLSIFKAQDQEKAKKISQTLATIKFDQNLILRDIDESPWGRIMVGTLGYLGNTKSLPALYNFLGSFKSDEAKADVCTAIGNVLSKAPDELLPAFLERANSSADIYTHIYIIKEMLSFRQQPFDFLGQLIEWLFQKCEAKLQVESNYYITSECVGKLAFLHPQATRTVVANAKASNPNRRLIVASSLRFGLQNTNKFDQNNLNDYLHAIVILMDDEKVAVREGAVKSLMTVGQSYPRGLKREAGEKHFWVSLVRNCRIDDGLIVVIDYGLCKEVRDDGKNLRLQSFNLVQMLAKKVHIDAPLIEELMEVSLNRLKEETSNDIVLKRLALLRTLCSLQFAPFIRLQDQFIAKVNPRDGLLKKYEKGGQEERIEIYLRGILKELSEIAVLAKEQRVDKLGTLVIQLRNSTTFGPLMEQIEKTK